jgi:hypothetical protein
MIFRQMVNPVGLLNLTIMGGRRLDVFVLGQSCMPALSLIFRKWSQGQIYVDSAV